MDTPPPGKFTHPLMVRNEDIHEQDHVNNVVYIRWVQEVAQAHWQSVASSDLRGQYLWVVLRHEIDYRNPVFPGDSVQGVTWVGDHHGPRFERFVRLQDPLTLQLYAEAKTTWCLVDASTKKPIRIPDRILDLL